ncbi:hypothetical protein BJ166DRAFT_29217 [Pestalotiopsis sp. NC0098]|nr:hypothetical protein BJ166DRAFT_29217 [Pestalotiopsis sp. NC0098]
MATVLGKRKSRASAAPKAAAPAANKPAVSEEEAREIFRRHFEAQFAPLAESTTEGKETSSGKKSKSKGGEKKQQQADDDVEDMRSSDEDEDEDEDDDEDDDSDDQDQDDWGGLSGSDDDEEEAEQDTARPNKIEVVDYSQSNAPTNPLAAALARREAKTYLSSKVPLSSVGGAEATNKPKSSKTKTPTDEDSADLVKNDLALQRLLSESHLFNPTKRSGSLIGSAVTTEHTGRNRHLATDMRVAALTENKNKSSSIFKQDKMPMSHRKGIEGARRDRDAKRRREAKENGIILEKATGSGKKGPQRSARERAVDAPAVGKLRNGMLKLSKRDVAEINGPVRRGNDKKKRRR